MMTTTIKRRLDDAVEFGMKLEEGSKYDNGYHHVNNNNNNNSNNSNNNSQDIKNMSNKIISPFEISKQNELHVGDEDGIFCIAVHPETCKVVTGLGSGLMHVYDTSDVKMPRLRRLRAGLASSLPLLALKFYPCLARDLLFSGGSNGLLQVWNFEDYNVLQSIEEQDNQIMAIDFTGDGMHVASVGKDACVRLYDTRNLKLTRRYAGTHTLDFDTIGNDLSVPGHSGKIFAVKFHPDNTNMLVTASWDQTLKIWDTRLECPVRTIHGPNVRGDGLDINHNNILTASWKAQHALQIWDFRMDSLLHTLTITNNNNNNNNNNNKSAGGRKAGEYLYCGRFWDDEHVVAGGSGTKDLKVIHVCGNRVVGTVSGSGHPVQTVEVEKKKKLIFCGTSGNHLKKINVSD